jgi:flavin reductase (DIM6/NTAB) family NADH-FMN oxidoreductase RutF
MSQTMTQDLVNLDLQEPIWERFFSVSPLVMIGTKEAEGEYDLAPKHRAMSLGDNNYFGFICTPRHHTYHNARREGVFTVSFPHPEQIIITSLAAAPRCSNDAKLSLTAIPTVPATVVDGILLQNAYLWLECELYRIIDGFGENSLITGRVVVAQVQKMALRDADIDDQDIIARMPLLAYISPGRYATIDYSQSFPFHTGFKR